MSELTFKDITIDDLQMWGYAEDRFLEVLRGDYDLDQAREDLLSLVNSEEFGRK